LAESDQKTLKVGIYNCPA